MATVRAFRIKKFKTSSTTQQSALSLMRDYIADLGGKPVEILRRRLHVISMICCERNCRK